VGGAGGRGGPRRLGTLRRERVTVRRGAVLADAEVLMQHHSRHKSVLEVLFEGEEGFGGAVTKEFYNKVGPPMFQTNLWNAIYDNQHGLTCLMTWRQISARSLRVCGIP
jgi:hypothetical protein